jgi:hypothetical protein
MLISPEFRGGYAPRKLYRSITQRPKDPCAALTYGRIESSDVLTDGKVYHNGIQQEKARLTSVIFVTLQSNQSN